MCSPGEQHSAVRAPVNTALRSPVSNQGRTKHPVAAPAGIDLFSCVLSLRGHSGAAHTSISSDWSGALSRCYESRPSPVGRSLDLHTWTRTHIEGFPKLHVLKIFSIFLYKYFNKEIIFKTLWMLKSLQGWLFVNLFYNSHLMWYQSVICIETTHGLHPIIIHWLICNCTNRVATETIGCLKESLCSYSAWCSHSGPAERCLCGLWGQLAQSPY